MSRLLSSTLRSQLSKRLIASAVKPSAGVARFTLPKLVATTSLRTFHQTSLKLNQFAELKQVLEDEKDIAAKTPNELDSLQVEFLKNEGYEVVDTKGTSNVELIKKTKDGKTIHIYFDVEETASIPAPEYVLEEMDEEIDELDEMFSNVKVLVEDSNTNQGLFFNLLLQGTEGTFSIDFLNFQSNAKEFISKVRSEGEFVDKFNYQGPKFVELDEALQTEFENYLEANGISTDLGEFILSYSEFKEEEEYKTWLNNVTTFFK